MKSAIPLPPRVLYEFGPFRLDAGRHLLLKDNQLLPLPPKAFEILVLLVERRGALFPKGDLLQEVWPDTFVEENNLTQYVSMLRKVLGDGVDDQKYIQTVPRLGYRFVSEVREIRESESEIVLSKETRKRLVLREEKEEEEQIEEGPVGAGARATSTEAAARRTTDAIEIATVRKAGLLGKRGWLLLAAVILFGLVGGGLWWRSARVRKTPEQPAVASLSVVNSRYSVAVLGLKNLSGRAEDDWLSLALPEMLSTELAAGGRLRVVSGEDIIRMKSDLRLADTESLAKSTLGQIRNQLGADITISGSFVELGKQPGRQLRLDLRIQDTSVGETTASIAESGTVEGLFQLVSRTGAELRAKLGAPGMTGPEAEELQVALPSNPEVARLYALGLSRLRNLDALEAQKLLAKAVSVDPDYALGHSALASAWSLLGYDERAKAEAKRAVDLSENLSREERLLIAGQYNELCGEREKAVESYKLLFSSYPDNLDYGLRLANSQSVADHGKDALTTVDQLRKLAPPTNQDPQIDLAQTVAAESLADFKQERDSAARAIQNSEILGERLLVARSWLKKGWALARLGEPKEATEGLVRARRLFAQLGDKQGVGATLHISGGIQSEQGNFVEAIRDFKQAIAIFRQIGDHRALALSINSLAIAHYERGEFRQAKALYEESLALEREVGSKDNTAGALGNLANVADAEGNLVEAHKLNEESLKVFEEIGNQRSTGIAMGNIAVLLYEMGDLQAAAKEFTQSIEIKKKIGYQRGVAYDLAGLGEVYRAGGDLNAAFQKHQEALTIRNQLGEKHNGAASHLYLANLMLEQQQPEGAEKEARQAAEEFTKEKSLEDEAATQITLALALYDEGRITDAREALNRAGRLLQKSTGIPLRFELDLATARLRRGQKALDHASDAQFERKLRASLAEAHKFGYLEYEFRLRLAIGEQELRSGNESRGRTHLEELAGDATTKGFGLVASKARALLNTPTAQSGRQSGYWEDATASVKSS